MESQCLKWVTSEGGPFVLMNIPTANSWLGVYGLSSTEWGDKNYVNDYDRACSIENYVGLITSDSNPIMVIGDLPYDLSWFPDGDDRGLIVKWIGADSDEDVKEAISHLNHDKFEYFPWEFIITDSDLVLFESSKKIDEVLDNRLNIKLLPGTYKVAFQNIEPNDFVSLHIIKLNKI
jgi:hypothetical protein